MSIYKVLWEDLECFENFLKSEVLHQDLQYIYLKWPEKIWSDLRRTNTTWEKFKVIFKKISYYTDIKTRSISTGFKTIFKLSNVENLERSQTVQQQISTLIN